MFIFFQQAMIWPGLKLHLLSVIHKEVAVVTRVGVR